ncbi:MULTISPECIES: HAD family hydrolase [Pseudanabaena]|uniref:5'-nucleotidase n=2 Tax=Pseudanabaena TaxID=1152 RepID=L8N2L0_9CYAN|nr:MULTISPECIES: HAD family hydrolase [Pseudanabaena]ELS33936.1 5'-nucleotidase [Pseudanabaena biceps PCC 7429]MDG3493845.1 HAD family hydrolase [Pseudanabaena catenata USMAC16]
MAAILFDLDGTLTDPKVGITTCIQYAIRQLGNEPPTTDELLWCIGPPLTTSFAKILQTEDRVLIDRAISLYRDRFSTIGLFENELYPEIPETLASIRAEGYQTYIATSKPHVYAQRIVEHFGLSDLFDGIYGSELDGTRSIKGELIRHILRAENLDAKATVMIGDRSHDTIAAKQNQVFAIGVTYGYGSAEELSNNGADVIANSPKEILPLIPFKL